MSQHGGTKAVKAAFLANGVIAIAKFTGAIFTGSAAMMAEAIHSLADTGNQILLLIGIKKAEKKADSQFNFGYGRAEFVVAMIVAVVLFVLGGVYAIYEGYNKIIHPEPLQYVGVIIGILGIAIAMEGRSFLIAYKEFKTESEDKGFFEYIKDSTNSSLIVILLEDAGALIGLTMATVGILLAEYVNPIFDGITSLAIGILMTGIAFTLVREVWHLLVGESMSPDEHNIIEKYIEDNYSNLITDVWKVKSMYIGNDKALVIIYIDWVDGINSDEIEDRTREVKLSLEDNFDNISDAIITTVKPASTIS